jgi:hypothetical protein
VILTPTWHKLAGFAKWITCRTVPPQTSADRLDVCRRCPSAQLRRALGWYFLTCGEPGEDHKDANEPTCGCGLGLVSRRSTAAIGLITDPDIRRVVALKQLRPKGKTRCVTNCPQGRW